MHAEKSVFNYRNVEFTYYILLKLFQISMADGVFIKKIHVHSYTKPILIRANDRYPKMIYF